MSRRATGFGGRSSPAVRVAQTFGPLVVMARVFNIALGRVGEFYSRVDTNDPGTSGLVVLVLAATGLEDDAVLKDKDTVAQVLAGTTAEVTNSGYARKILTDTDLAAMAPDDTTDGLELSIPDQSWSDVAAGDAWAAVVIAYDPDTGTGDDTELVPLTLHPFAITPDGSTVSARINPGGFYRAA